MYSASSGLSSYLVTLFWFFCQVSGLGQTARYTARVTSRSSATDHCHDLWSSCKWLSAVRKGRECEGEIGSVPNNHVSWWVLVVELKVKQSHYRPGQALRVPGGWGPQNTRQSANEGGKVVGPTHRPSLPQEIFVVLISVRGCLPQGHNAAGRIMSMKNSSDTIGNRTRDILACSAMP